MNTLKNRAIFIGDNFEVLSEIEDGTIDLIYLDPPFNSRRSHNARNGTFRDVWSEDDRKEEQIEYMTHQNAELVDFLSALETSGGRMSVAKNNSAYLWFIAPRLLHMRRVLKPTGLLYLHCDTKMSHWLKLVLDCIFGASNFRNEIIWYYNSGARTKKDFGRRHDVILRYSKTPHYIVNFDTPYAREPYSPNINIPLSKQHYYNPQGKVLDDVWRIKIIAQNHKTERVGYPTQKPRELLERIIATSSRKGDIVLDPFCGSGTTCVVAEDMGRQWMGIDVNKDVVSIIRRRMGGVAVSVCHK